MEEFGIFILSKLIFHRSYTQMNKRETTRRGLPENSRQSRSIHQAHQALHAELREIRNRLARLEEEHSDQVINIRRNLSDDSRAA